MKKMSTRQRIDASHEARMWIKDVIIPGITAAVFVDRLNPGLKYKLYDWGKGKIDKAKEKLNTKR